MDNVQSVITYMGRMQIRNIMSPCYMHLTAVTVHLVGCHAVQRIFSELQSCRIGADSSLIDSYPGKSRYLDARSVLHTRMYADLPEGCE